VVAPSGPVYHKWEAEAVKTGETEISRARGGSYFDPDRLVALGCPWHSRTHAAYDCGPRLGSPVTASTRAPGSAGSSNPPQGDACLEPPDRGACEAGARKIHELEGRFVPRDEKGR
jgi:hypothetical protein